MIDKSGLTRHSGDISSCCPEAHVNPSLSFPSTAHLVWHRGAIRRAQGHTTYMGAPFACSWPAGLLLPHFKRRMALSLSKGHLDYFRQFLIIIKAKTTMPAWFYILRLRSGTLYPGATKNLEERYKDHQIGNACRTTKLDPSVELAYSEKYETFSEARRREAQIKHWSRAKKEALVAGDLLKLKQLSKSRK